MLRGSQRSSGSSSSLIDINFQDLVDVNVMKLTPDAPLSLCHNIFRQLGLSHVFVVHQGVLKGFITKKNFVAWMQRGGAHTTDTVAVAQKARRKHHKIP